MHLLARLTGHKLLEFPMNCDTDVMELVGGFDQVSKEGYDGSYSVTLSSGQSSKATQQYCQ